MSRHIHELTPEEFHAMREHVEESLAGFRALHPDACHGCTGQLLLLTILAMVREAGYTEVHVLEDVLKVYKAPMMAPPKMPDVPWTPPSDDGPPSVH